jgi:uncharacterized repeat protein (TIGR01451 family)
MTPRLAPLSLVLLATILALLPQPATAERAAPLPTLQGEAALAHLRREGLDGSLAEILTAARYSARPTSGRPDEITFHNPAQRLRARFDGRGLALESGTAADRHRLTLRLLSLGYGERQLPVGPGEVSMAGQRVEYAYPIESGSTAAVREWFVNRPESLEHGFTLAEPPGERRESEPLRLVLGLGGELRAREVEGGQALELVDAAGRRVLRYDHLRVSDAGGRELPARMRVAGGELSFEIDDSGARFPVTIDPAFTQQAYVKASNTGAYDEFGWTVAISGDTLVIGVPFEDSTATGVDGDQSNDLAPGSGAAYVFVRSAGEWSQQAYLKASNTGAGDYFGFSVAISGDILVVGAPRENSNTTGINGDQSNDSAPFSGAAYVFVRSAGVWSQQAYLKASNTGAGDSCGWSVAISGDTLVVGAPGESSSATGVDGDQSNNLALYSGAAYVFVRSAGVWSQQAYLKASNTDASDFFGQSMAISGDTLVVGASLEDSNATGVDGDQLDNSAQWSGAAYVFVRSAGSWSQQAYLKASNTDGGDEFGHSVAISGDILVVGAPHEASNAIGVDGDQSNDSTYHAGAAYVFVRSAGVWSQQAYLKASNTGWNDWFGYSVAISGDTLVVGAFVEGSNATGVDGNQWDNSAPQAGAAYVFRRSAVWSQQAYLKASNTDGPDQFGWSVAISDNTVVAGARGERSNATGVGGDQSNNSVVGAGAAYVFVPLPGSDLEMAKVADAPNPLPGDTVVFTLTATNQGFSAATGVIVTDTLPPGLNYGSNDCGATFATPALTWTIGALADLAFATCHLTVTVDADAPDTLVNSATVTGNETDPDPGDNEASATLTIPVDLEIVKTADDAAPAPGDTVVFTLTVTNQGPAVATGVVVTDTLPAGLTYGSNDCGAAFAGSTLTWTIGALAHLASVTCHLTVTIDAGPPPVIINFATVDGNEFDPQISDNTAYAVLMVPVADLQIQKTADVTNPLPGGTVVFTLTVANQGPDGATGVIVIDTLPAGLSYGSNDCGAAFASPTLTWAIGDLANLAWATCHLSVTVDAGASGAIVNTAAVDGNEFDPQTGDNAADAMLSLPMDYYTLTPCRLVDTRLADGPLGGPVLAANVARDFVLAGACGIPADAAAVVLNVTAIGPTAAGSVQIYKAGGTPLAGGGTVYYRAGVTRAGNGIVTLGAGGTVTALAKQPAGTVHLILDVAGYFF